MFIVLCCCLLVRVQPLSLAWAGLHDTESLWALFQEPIVEFRLGYCICYLGTSTFSPQQREHVITYEKYDYLNKKENVMSMETKTYMKAYYGNKVRVILA